MAADSHPDKQKPLNNPFASATEWQKYQAFEWLRNLALNNTEVGRIAGLCLSEWSRARDSLPQEPINFENSPGGFADIMEEARDAEIEAPQPPARDPMLVRNGNPAMDSGQRAATEETVSLPCLLQKKLAQQTNRHTP